MFTTFLMVVCFIAVSERAQREADGDGEDGDGSRERYQQTAAQHRLHRGKHIVWQIPETSSGVMSHNTV